MGENFSGKRLKESGKGPEGCRQAASFFAVQSKLEHDKNNRRVNL
jgi:hypothetical protein